MRRIVSAILPSQRECCTVKRSRRQPAGKITCWRNVCRCEAIWMEERTPTARGPAGRGARRRHASKSCLSPRSGRSE